MKKRTFILGLVLLLAIALMGCAKKAEAVQTPDGSNAVDQPAPTVVTTWAGFTEDKSIWKGSLNQDRKLINDKSLPIYRFDSTADLEKFRSEHTGVYDFDGSYQEVPSFNETAAKYDDAFFSEHAILLVYMSSGTDNVRYAIKDVQFADSRLLVTVVRTNYPEAPGDGHAGWFFIIEINRTDYPDCSSYDALSPYLL